MTPIESNTAKLQELKALAEGLPDMPNEPDTPSVPSLDGWITGEATIMSSPQTKAPDITVDDNATTYLIIPSLTKIPDTIYLEWTEEDSYGEVFDIQVLIDDGELVRASWNTTYIDIESIEICEQGIKITFNSITHSRAGVVAKYMYNNTLGQDYTSKYHIKHIQLESERTNSKIIERPTGCNLFVNGTLVNNGIVFYFSTSGTPSRYDIDLTVDIQKDYIALTEASGGSAEKKYGYRIDGDTIYAKMWITL